MPPESEFIPGLFVRDDDEGLFSRDINGNLFVSMPRQKLITARP